MLYWCVKIEANTLNGCSIINSRYLDVSFGKHVLISKRKKFSKRKSLFLHHIINQCISSQYNNRVVND